MAPFTRSHVIFTHCTVCTPFVRTSSYGTGLNNWLSHTFTISRDFPRPSGVQGGPGTVGTSSPLSPQLSSVPGGLSGPWNCPCPRCNGRTRSLRQRRVSSEQVTVAIFLKPAVFACWQHSQKVFRDKLLFRSSRTSVYSHQNNVWMNETVGVFFYTGHLTQLGSNILTIR